VELPRSLLEASPKAEWILNQSLTYEFDAVMPAVAAEGLFNSLCTIKARSGAVSSQGQLNMQSYAPIADLTDIPCRIAVQAPANPPQNDVARMQQQFDTRTEFHVLLDGYFPQILQQNLANVNGIDYEIMATEPDSDFQMTRLAVRVYTL
jgi:hypothetical protein